MLSARREVWAASIHRPPDHACRDFPADLSQRTRADGGAGLGELAVAASYDTLWETPLGLHLGRYELELDLSLDPPTRLR